MKKPPRSTGFVPFIDGAFMIVLILAALFIVQFLQQKGLDPQFDYVVQMTWPNESTADIDLHVKDPAGNHLYFRAHEVGLMHLSQDDRGIITDRSYDANGKLVELKENLEKATIRKTMDGWYTINAHKWAGDDRVETPVTIELYTARHHSVRKLLTSHFVLKLVGDEKTAFRVYIKDGAIVKKDFTFHSIIEGGH